ncbi:hypothetical protein GQ600_21068 [Phytophthora cactorum]|nr:hypothetical protein GQ600_21068 [Phytophthora cactorum]
MDLPAAPSVSSDNASPTNSSSEPSPQAADAKPKTAPSPPPSHMIVKPRNPFRNRSNCSNKKTRSRNMTSAVRQHVPAQLAAAALPHTLKAHHHLQHLRVYGKSTGPAKSVSECHEEGAPMVALLCIELLEDGLSATTLIAKEAPNTGFFTYHKVPWGMESGSKYFCVSRRPTTRRDTGRAVSSGSARPRDGSYPHGDDEKKGEKYRLHGGGRRHVSTLLPTWEDGG